MLRLRMHAIKFLMYGWHRYLVQTKKAICELSGVYVYV